VIGVLGVILFAIKLSRDNLAASSTEIDESDNSSGQFADLIGKPASGLTLTDMNGNTYTEESFRGKNAVFFFNEGLMCYPACWNQVVALAQDTRFQENDVRVVSVVVDSPEDWRRFLAKAPQLDETNIMFDKNGSVSKALGMLKAASSMHAGSFPGHTYVVLDKEGIVRHVFDDPSMAIHNDQLINEIDKLN